MPASIAHMLFSRKTREALGKEKDPELKKFSAFLEKHKYYMELGSLGPDLPYYGSLAKGALDLLLDRSDKPLGVDGWSYQLHSRNPNIFPLKMVEVAWREAGKTWDEPDEKKFAFICGFLTHMAADQIIHPVVNDIAGPYYKGGANREKHREVEVYQDVVLYNTLEKSSIMDAKPNEWCDLNPGLGSNTEDWFCFFIQKAFVEAHAVCPEEQEVENWVDGILSFLRGMNNLGPYVKAARDYKDLGLKSDKYIKYIKEKDYTGKYYNEALALCVVYVKAAFKLHSIEDDAGFTDDQRKKFKEVVINADLSSPLQVNILAGAEAALKSWK